MQLRIYIDVQAKETYSCDDCKGKGLEGLATYIMSQDATVSVPEEALKYLNEEHEVNEADTAIS